MSAWGLTVSVMKIALSLMFWPRDESHIFYTCCAEAGLESLTKLL